MIILNYPIAKFCGAVGLILSGLAIQLHALEAAGSAPAKSCVTVATLTIANGLLFTGRDHSPSPQTDQVTLDDEERAGEQIDQIDMDDDASASLNDPQSSHPAYKAYLWVAQSGYLPNNSGRSLQGRGPPVSRI